MQPHSILVDSMHTITCYTQYSCCPLRLAVVPLIYAAELQSPSSTTHLRSTYMYNDPDQVTRC